MFLLPITRNRAYRDAAASPRFRPEERTPNSEKPPHQAHRRPRRPRRTPPHPDPGQSRVRQLGSARRTFNISPEPGHQGLDRGTNSRAAVVAPSPIGLGGRRDVGSTRAKKVSVDRAPVPVTFGTVSSDRPRIAWNWGDPARRPPSPRPGGLVFPIRNRATLKAPSKVNREAGLDALPGGPQPGQDLPWRGASA